MIEPRHFWSRLAALACLATALCTGGLAPAQAQTNAGNKLAADLSAVVAAPAGSPTTVPWAKNLNGVLHVKVLINANSTDATLAALRADILARGGSVTYNYLSVRALSAMLPAADVPAVAARTDVLGISPNRAVTRHAAKATSVTSTASTTTAAADSTALGFDGAGVGIAILDSGIDWKHHYGHFYATRCQPYLCLHLVGGLRSGAFFKV